MIDLISALFLFIGYILTGNKNKIGWIFSLIGNLGYVFILYTSEFKGLFYLSILMSIICIYNFIIWNYAVHRKTKKK